MNWYKTSQTRFSTNIPTELSGLVAEARKCDSFEEFERDYIHQIKHGTYWHVTDSPEFTIDKEKGPRDMSSLSGGDSIDKGKLMITSHLEYWIGYGNREYAALIDMSDVPREAYYQVNRGFGNEFMVADPSNAKVVSVMSIDDALAYDGKIHSEIPQSEDELRGFYETVHSEDNYQEPQVALDIE